MKSTLPLLASTAALASAQWHGGWHGSGHGDHGFGGGWEWGGDGYSGHHGHMHAPAGNPTASGYKNSTFDQLIDHKNPHLGTFSQFYYYSDEFWKGPGSPVILFTPGEINATGYYTYLGTNRTTGLLAEKIGAAVVVLEHRYWGVSSPFAELTTENMQYLTLDNALKDMDYFASSVKLPFAKNIPSNAADVPWVAMGGSYSGALSAWLANVYPGTLWAYHASSAPVQAISDYWGYFPPIQEGMPKNCSKDVTLVIDHMDDILMHGTTQEIHDLKAKFMMEKVEHNDDFMDALANGPYLWQGNQFYTNTGFFTWCDYIENSVNKTGSAVAGPDGVGLEKALNGYASWWKTIGLPGTCAATGYWTGNYSTECFNTYNASSPIFTDTSLSNQYDRQWEWMLCNEPFGYWQTGAPENRPTIVSRLVTPEYFIRQCSLYFPPGPEGQTFGIAKGKTEGQENAYTGGWFIDNTTRLIYVNGQNDPWRESGVSAELRPGGPLQGTSRVPVEIVPGGYHTSDLITQNGNVNPGVKAVQDRVLQQLADWVAEYPKKHYWKA